MSEHAVLAHLKLTKGAFGDEEEVEAIHDLSDQLAEAIEVQDVGEFDGDEFGKWQCTLYMYGPDADALFEVIQPILRDSSCACGGFVVKRYGEASDAEAREVRVDV